MDETVTDWVSADQRTDNKHSLRVRKGPARGNPPAATRGSAASRGQTTNDLNFKMIASDGESGSARRHDLDFGPLASRSRQTRGRHRRVR